MLTICKRKLAKQYLHIIKDMQVFDLSCVDACKKNMKDPDLWLVIYSMVGDQNRKRSDGGINYIAWAHRIIGDDKYLDKIFQEERERNRRFHSVLPKGEHK